MKIRIEKEKSKIEEASQRAQFETLKISFEQMESQRNRLFEAKKRREKEMASWEKKIQEAQDNKIQIEHSVRNFLLDKVRRNKPCGEIGYFN